MKKDKLLQVRLDKETFSKLSELSKENKLDNSKTVRSLICTEWDRRIEKKK